jgi:hypothetical protein
MLVIEEDDATRVFLHEYGTWCVRVHISLNEEKDVVIAYNPSSSLYPMYLPRETEDGKIIHDIYNNNCQWYIFDKKVEKEVIVRDK